MTSKGIDDFGARLLAEWRSLDELDRNEILRNIHDRERQMLSSGQERPEWKGPLREEQILGREVKFPSRSGDQVGRAVFFGISPSGGSWERSVIVQIPGSGSLHEALGSQISVPGIQEILRMERGREMADRLRAIGDKDPTPPRKPAVRGPKVPKDTGFINELHRMAQEHANVLSIEEGSVCHKIIGHSGRKLYLFRSQMRCNIGGFCPSHPGVKPITEQQAKEMHLGSIRGQIDLGVKELAREAFSVALQQLDE